jgi:hypothetical protein
MSMAVDLAFSSHNHQMIPDKEETVQGMTKGHISQPVDYLKHAQCVKPLPLQFFFTRLNIN